MQRARDQAIGIGLAACVSITAATWAHDRLFHRGSAAEVPAPAPDAGRKPAGFDPATTVILAEGKFAVAGIRLGVARAEQVAREVAVAGRIEADPNRRIEVRSRAPGVVRTLPAQPGSMVKAGDVLVRLDSSEVGSARLLVRERQRALATARAEASWKSQVAANAEAMIVQLKHGASARELTREFADKLVGTARGTLVAAWAELEIATHEADKQASLNKQKVVGEHPVFVAEHTREGAQARFDAALEQVRFNVAQQDRVARQLARDAEEMVVDAAQKLQVLGVAEDVADLVAHPEQAAGLASALDDLAGYAIVAPIDGTVVSTSATISRRVDVIDPLFVVADLSRVYAVANIPESDFAALPGLDGGAVHVAASAYPDRVFAARMLYAGAEVDPATRTVRLVAEAENPDGLLKLGMFARIALDAKATEAAVVVPPGAVVDLDGVSVVFRPDPKDPHTFTRHAVKLGRDTPGGRVVASGLRAGDPVVVAGAFQLKSELILQNETEED